MGELGSIDGARSGSGLRLHEVATRELGGPTPIVHELHEPPGQLSGVVYAVEVGEDSEHTAMGVFAVGDVELGEDVADVGFDGAFADHEPVGDGGVGESLGHEFEHAPLALGEPADGSAVGGRDEVGDHHRVKG